MNRIDKTLERVKKNKTKILSPYITAGDPEPQITVPILHALVEAGADILELGIPFSDPMAEGPAIQAAMERALKYNIGIDDVLEMVRTFRKKNDQTPVILMGYLNPIEQYGYSEFALKAKEAGVDGTILVDMPPEESEEVAKIWDSVNLYPIYLCSPTTTDQRLKEIKRFGRGYLYYVSLKGVTGASSFDLKTVNKQYTHLKKQAELPIMVGFGIKTPERAAQVAAFADGVIVGAALIEQIQLIHQQAKTVVPHGVELIKHMRMAMDNLV